MNDPQLIFPEQRPTRADAVKNRMLLLETAARLFAERGVEAVTMSEVAEAAGVGKGTLYRHFNNKTELAYALLDQEQRDLQERTLRYLQGSPEPCVALHWFIEQCALFVARNLDLLYVGGDGGAPPMLDHRAHYWWRQTIRALLLRLDPPGDVDYLTDVLFVMLNVATIRFQMFNLGYSLPRVLNGLENTLARLTA